jgi:hypothetical protein
MVRGLSSGMVAHEEDFFVHLTPAGVHIRKVQVISSSIITCTNKVDLSMPHERKRSGGSSCAPCRGKKTYECAGSAISSGAWILARRLRACATLVTISTVQGAYKRLVFLNSYGAVEKGWRREP